MNYSDTRLPDFTPFLQRCPPVFFYRYWIVGWLGFFAIKIAEWKRVGLTSFFFFLIRIDESKLIGDLNTQARVSSV